MVSVSSVFLESFTKQTGPHFDMLQFCEGLGNFVNPAACSREVNLREVHPFWGASCSSEVRRKNPRKLLFAVANRRAQRGSRGEGDVSLQFSFN